MESCTFYFKTVFLESGPIKQRLGNNFSRGMKGAKLNIVNTVKAVYL